MKKIITAAAALSFVASATFAGTDYPVEMTKDGVLYNCAADSVMVDGVEARNCITVGGASESGGGLFALGGLAGGAGLAAIAALVVGVAVIAADDDDNTTVGTN